MGEFGTTLEEVAALICLPMFGDTNPIKVTLDKTDEKKLEALKNAYFG